MCMCISCQAKKFPEWHPSDNPFEPPMGCKDT